MPIYANFGIFYFHFSRFSRLSFSTFFQNRSIVMTRSTCKSIVLYIESNEYCEGLVQLNLNPFQYSFVQYICRTWTNSIMYNVLFVQVLQMSNSESSLQSSLQSLLQSKTWYQRERRRSVSELPLKYNSIPVRLLSIPVISSYLWGVHTSSYTIFILREEFILSIHCEANTTIREEFILRIIHCEANTTIYKVILHYTRSLLKNPTYYNTSNIYIVIQHNALLSSVWLCSLIYWIGTVH